MRITLKEFFGRLETLTANLKVELDVGDNPAAGSLAEAAKNGGIPGLFRYLKDSTGAASPSAGDALADIIKSLEGLSQSNAAAAAKPADPSAELLKAAGAKGIDAFAQAMGKLIKEVGADAGKDSEAAASGSGKAPDTGVAPVDTDKAVITADNTPTADERPALPAADERRDYSRSVDIV